MAQARHGLNRGIGRDPLVLAADHRARFRRTCAARRTCPALTGTLPRVAELHDRARSRSGRWASARRAGTDRVPAGSGPRPRAGGCCGACIDRQGKRGQHRGRHGGWRCPLRCARFGDRHGRADPLAHSPSRSVGCRARSDGRVCRRRGDPGPRGARAPSGGRAARARRTRSGRADPERRARPRICKATHQVGNEVAASYQVGSEVVASDQDSSEVTTTRQDGSKVATTHQVGSEAATQPKLKSPDARRRASPTKAAARAGKRPEPSRPRPKARRAWTCSAGFLTMRRRTPSGSLLAGRRSRSSVTRGSRGILSTLRALRASRAR